MKGFTNTDRLITIDRYLEGVMEENLRETVEELDSPPYYRALDDSDIECIDAIRAALWPAGLIEYAKGSIIAYTWRLGRKDGNGLSDAIKIRKYCEFLIATLYDIAGLEMGKEAEEYESKGEDNVVPLDIPEFLKKDVSNLRKDMAAAKSDPRENL